MISTREAPRNFSASASDLWRSADVIYALLFCAWRRLRRRVTTSRVPCLLFGAGSEAQSNQVEVLGPRGVGWIGKAWDGHTCTHTHAHTRARTHKRTHTHTHTHTLTTQAHNHTQSREACFRICWDTELRASFGLVIENFTASMGPWPPKVRPSVPPLPFPPAHAHRHTRACTRTRASRISRFVWISKVDLH